MGKLYLILRVQSGLQTFVSQPLFPHWMVETLGRAHGYYSFNYYQQPDEADNTGLILSNL